MAKTLAKKSNKKLRKTVRYFKGGFNTAQLAGALAMLVAVKMDKLVLIPKPEATSSKRYDVVVEDVKGFPKLKSNKLMIPGTKSNISIGNFNLYIGSTKNDLLIKVDGNESIINRLAKLSETLMVPENANALITVANEHELITDVQARDVRKEVNEVKKIGDSIKKAKEPMPINTKSVNLLLELLSMFFGILFMLLSHKKEENVPSIETSSALVTSLVTYDKAEQIMDEIDEILELPQFKDQGPNKIPISLEDKDFKCIKPYNKSTASKLDRKTSCNRAGPSTAKFENRTWSNLQSCVEECNKE